MSVIDSLFLSQTAFVCKYVRHSDSMCLSQKISVCHRLLLDVKVSLCLSQTKCVRHRQSFSVIDCLCLSPKVYVIHRQLFLSQKIFVFQRTKICLSQTLCPGHRQSVYFPDSLSMIFLKYINEIHQDLFVKF